MKTYIIKVHCDVWDGYDIFNVTAPSLKAAIEKVWGILDYVDDGIYAGISSHAITITEF